MNHTLCYFELQRSVPVRKGALKILREQALVRLIVWGNNSIKFRMRCNCNIREKEREDCNWQMSQKGDIRQATVTYLWIASLSIHVLRKGCSL